MATPCQTFKTMLEKGDDFEKALATAWQLGRHYERTKIQESFKHLYVFYNALHDVLKTNPNRKKKS